MRAISVGSDEDLGLVHEAAEGLGVDYAVPVTLELITDAVGGFGPLAAGARLAGPCASHAGRLRLGLGLWEGVTGGVSQDVGADDPQDALAEPVLRRLPRIGVSIMALSRSNVPGASGRRRL